MAFEPLAKWAFRPNSALCSKFYPRNISYMPAVKFSPCLDFERKSHFARGSLESEFVDVDSTCQDVRRFRCGKSQMDAFLIRFAQKNAGLGISKTWVLLDQDKGEKKKFPIAAYYTLAVGTVTRETLPINHPELPSYPVPVTLLARLAVSEGYQKRGLGGKTLVTALRQAVILKDRGLPLIGVVLDVLDQDALNFYNHFQVFHCFSDNPMRLFVPMQVIQQL